MHTLTKARQRQTATPFTGCIIYLRVSSPQQGVSRLGLEAQETACRAWATAHGYSVDGIYSDDGVSGARAPSKRPGLTAALLMVGKGSGRMLLVHSLSRFARSNKDLMALVMDEREPVPLVSATEQFDLTTAMGRMFVGMLGVVAQMESDLASERMLSAWDARRAREAQMPGGPPPPAGYAPEAIALAVRLRGEGMSQENVVAELNNTQWRGPHGGRWHLGTVQRLLKRCRPAENRERMRTLWTKHGGDIRMVAQELKVAPEEVDRWISQDKGLRRALLG